MTKTVFTITSGRTGTAWLAEFFAINFPGTSIHEPSGIEDYGVNMPSIRTMRSFNEFGNNDEVRRFWSGKFAGIGAHDFYAETNHTLAKCGLVENLAQSCLLDGATLVILRRDILKVASSLLMRGDFNHLTLMWQWYLFHGYRLKLVNPQPFESLGAIGRVLWYCYEMEARQCYYLSLYHDKMNMVQTTLEAIVTEEGSQTFFYAVGGTGKPTLPDPKNASLAKPSEELVENLRDIISKLRFNPTELVNEAISQGFSFEPA